MIDTLPQESDLTVIPEGQSAGLLDMSEAELELFGASMPTLEEAYPGVMIPRSKWKDLSQKMRNNLHDDVVKIYSQGRSSACVGFALAQAVMGTRVRRFGKANWVSLSGMFSYKLTGGTFGSGTSIKAGCDGGFKGLLPEDTAENRAKFAHTYSMDNFNQPVPPNWLDTGKFFAIAKIAKARGSDEICSGLLSRLCGITGRDGHCIPYLLLDFYKDDPYARGPNSWGKGWNARGWLEDPEKIFRDLTVYFIIDLVVPSDMQF